MDYNFYPQHTHSPLTGGYPVKLANVVFTKNSTPLLHCYEEVVFQYIAKGSAAITCDDDVIHAYTGDILFINQSVKHLLAPAINDHCFLRSIIVNPSFLFGIDQLEMENKYVTPIIADNFIRCIHINSQDSSYPKFLPLMKNLIALNEAKESCYELLSKSCLLQLWKLLYDKIAANPCSMHGTARTVTQDTQRIKQAAAYIQEHYAEPVTLEDIANSILVSKSECCRCFKRTLNMSPIEYLMKCRITESVKRMHKRAHEPISEIAGAVGFNNTSYYNKVFRKFMGCTPTEYRQTLKRTIDLIN